jgi:hypothetical protein
VFIALRAFPVQKPFDYTPGFTLEKRTIVSPTYGYIESALVKCSNEGGLGPRYNREEDPWSSIFSMLMVYGCYLHLLTFSRKQVTGRINGDPFPPFQPSWAEPPSLPPGVCTPPPAKDGSEVGLGKITLQPLIRGQRPRIGLEDDVGTILGFSAPLYEVGQLSWRPAQVDRRAPSERFCVSSQENQGGPVQPRRTMAGRYGA